MNSDIKNHVLCFFSSRRRHTILTCDWSSDVCSSDLGSAKTEQTTMRSSTLVATGVLMASAVAAQSTASEQIFTVQTSIPTAFQSRSTGLVDCNCVQEPCTACAQSRTAQSRANKTC